MTFLGVSLAYRGHIACGLGVPHYTDSAQCARFFALLFSLRFWLMFVIAVVVRVEWEFYVCCCCPTPFPSMLSYCFALASVVLLMFLVDFDVFGL